jgi:hypothetical protein
MKKKLLIALVGSMIFFACSKSNEEELKEPASPGGGNCDTVNMKYAANVVPILSSHCYSCHGVASNTNSNGIILEGHDKLFRYATDGTLISVITHAPGFPQMPQGAAKLSDCNINIIRSWVNNGAQHN